MVDTLEEFKKQHLDNYKKAILELVNNNTDVLVDEDIMSLIRKPPLDSMDLIKSKFLDLAKKNKIVLETVKLDDLLEEYRNIIIKVCGSIKKERVSILSKVVSNTSLEKETDVIKFNKKDFNDINKSIKKILKDTILESIEKTFIKKGFFVFSSDIDDAIKKKICDEVIKFVKGTYQKQLLENVDIKLLVKDTTLINSVKEHGERHLFTLANSRIFKQNND